MSTKTTTTSQNQSNLQYDPKSLGTYQNLTGSAGKVLSGYMNNPFGNPFFNLGAQFAQKGASQQGQNNINAMTQNMLTSGLGGQAGAGFKMAQLGKIGRSNASMMSQANLGNVMQALQRQLGAAGTGLAFQPLMTGTSSTGQETQTKSGLGTWLPQLLSTGIGAAMAPFTGGASMLGPTMGGSMGGGMASAMAQGAPSPFNLPGNSFSMPNIWAGSSPSIPSFNPFTFSGIGS